MTIALIDVADLEALIRKAVREEIAGAKQPAKTVFTRAEAAAFLGCHVTSLPKLVAEGGLKATKLGTHWRFRREDLEAWMAARAESKEGI